MLDGKEERPRGPIREFIEEHGDIEAWRMMSKRIERILDGSNPLGQGTLRRMEIPY